MTKIVKFPFGSADKIAAVAVAAVFAVSITNTETMLSLAQLTADATLDLDIHAEMEVGANLTVKVGSDAHSGGWSLILGTGITGADVALAASKNYALTFKYDGAAFVLTGTQILN